MSKPEIKIYFVIRISVIPVKSIIPKCTLLVTGNTYKGALSQNVSMKRGGQLERNDQYQRISNEWTIVLNSKRSNYFEPNFA